MQRLNNDLLAEIKAYTDKQREELDLIAEIKVVEKLNEVASLRKRRERHDKASKECTRRIIELIYDAKASGLHNAKIASATGYAPSYIAELLQHRPR